ncbi:hypothetical protein G7Y79_00072g097500 [Physcia stellaris]|nr:hypothetical protein G7Y79_00072g097500 [Physcia stellaris]
MSHLSLDWREAPTTSQIVARIERLFTELDANRAVGLRLSSTTAKGAVVLEELDGVHLFLRKDEKITRRFNKGTVAYWKGMFELGASMADHLMSQEDVMNRFVEYKECRPKDMTMAQVRKNIKDLAVTIGVHPWALGIKPEGNGQISVPRGVTITMKLVKNMQLYRDRDVLGGRPRDYLRETAVQRQSGATTISPLIDSLTVAVKEHAPVRAVLVIEHRNLKQLMSAEEIGDVILIMTSGCPGSATKELLHMLYRSEQLASVPFLYFSDHDFEGVQIFYNLKYGTVTSAWCNQTEVCPKLRWVGPSRKDLLESPAAFKAQHEAQFRRDRPHQSDDNVIKAMDSWESKMSKKLNNKLVKSTKRDRSLFAGFCKAGWLDYEPELKAELEMMLESASKFRLADLTQVGNLYAKVYVRDKVEDLSPVKVRTESVKAKQPISVRSPTGERYKDIDSQALLDSVPEPPASEADSLASQVPTAVPMTKTQKEELLKNLEALFV